MADIAVIILNFNGIKFLKQFLPSVIKLSPEADIIVADNLSTDDSINFLQTKHPSVKLLIFNSNYGYAGGYNKAIEELEYEFCILLNSDIEVTKNWISPIIKFMRDNPFVAACQPKILDFHKKSHFEYAGAAGGFLDSLGFPYCRGRIFDNLEEDIGQYNQNSEVFWATGASMFVRRKDFLSVGGFDSDFFAHMEEIDLCWRFLHHGKKVFCIPESVIYHVGGGTLNKVNSKKTYLNFRNNLSLIFKNESLLNLLWKLPIKFPLDWLAAIKFWKDISFSHFTAVFKAHRDFLLLIPSNVKKRKKLSSVKNHSKNHTSPILLPYVFFIKGLKKFSDIHKID